MSAEALSIDVEAALPEFTLRIAQDLTLDGATAVFGPSGAGKTTLMRLIAGFDAPKRGRIALGGDVWFDARERISRPPWARPVGYMFQDARLFPHLDVLGNLKFADRRSADENRRYTLDEIAEAFALPPLLGRRVQSLSGGERQRVALARTLLARPKLLLLDEPLAALDRRRKNEILPYLKDLPSRFGVPTIFISHDIEEVSQLADHVLVMAEGRAQDYGPAVSVISNLDLAPLTGRHEISTLLEGTVAEHDKRLRLTRVAAGGASITLPMNEAFQPGAAIRLRIRAQDLAIATSEPHDVSIRNVIPGEIAEIKSDPLSPYAEAVIDISSARLRAQITRAALEALKLEPGRAVFALIKSVSIDGRF